MARSYSRMSDNDNSCKLVALPHLPGSSATFNARVKSAATIGKYYGRHENRIVGPKFIFKNGQPHVNHETGSIKIG